MLRINCNVKKNKLLENQNRIKLLGNSHKQSFFLEKIIFFQTKLFFYTFATMSETLDE
ncbi:MAG: hypothetical protein BWY27_00180 [Bacteroidetes bacterium ADurb.Bin234]|nr:MAG: hypothetical protein BWY27_00180 [Bacteroidetes bacterium ADurb.Bin234]